ncbi:hypothetical protein HQQ94_21945 [Shewanella sp. VB17]|uniref:hypothetical protein n=1 Tax=Shewanella sp. VB17 TaxID=2739432 RepID=UPI0015649592|nr:hypothetical protein [Shewanella sp. VB17]NRD75830.1 hypothetical protein [Shewanella sp. VB17]
MKKATKAVLISAFVCPGGGHFYLKCYKTGTLLSIATLGTIVYLLNQAVSRAREISEQIVSGQIPLDINIIYPLITQQPVAEQALWNNIAGFVLGISWVVGVIGAYRQGTVVDKTEDKTDTLV